MKRIATVFSALLGATCLASVAAAQAGPVPSISSIPVRQADNPGNIVINGANLGLVTDVKIDGVPVPIFKQKADRLVVGPLGPELPRFAAVRVSGGNNSATGTLSLLPTLAARRQGFAVFPTIHNGASGAFVLRYSYQADLGNAVDQGIYGRRFLTATATVSSVGFIPDGNPFLAPPFALPIEIGAIGETLKMQAEVSNDVTGLTRYTNLAQVTGFGNPQ